MTIRNYRPEDIDQVVEVWYKASMIAHSFIPKEKLALHEDEIRRKYLPMALTYVAEEEGKIFGFISLLDNFIGGLFVEPSKQGFGIGRKLIDKAFEGKDHLMVGVYKKNQKARDFYQKVGFKYESEDVQNETGEIVINMTKEQIRSGLF